MSFYTLTLIAIIAIMCSIDWSPGPVAGAKAITVYMSKQGRKGVDEVGAHTTPPPQTLYASVAYNCTQV